MDEPLALYHSLVFIDECAKYSASKLVEITHNQIPWKKEGTNQKIADRKKIHRQCREIAIGYLSDYYYS